MVDRGDPGVVQPGHGRHHSLPLPGPDDSHSLGRHGIWTKKKNKKCRGPFPESCRQRFWISSNDVTGIKVPPPPPAKWGNQSAFIVRQAVTDKETGLDHRLIPTGTDLAGIVADHQGTARWQILRKGPGVWNLKSTKSKRRSGECLYYVKANGTVLAKTRKCGDNVDQQFKIRFAGRSSFYVQSKKDPRRCLDGRFWMSNTARFVPCDSKKDDMRWRFTKHPAHQPGRDRARGYLRARFRKGHGRRRGQHCGRAFRLLGRGDFRRSQRTRRVQRPARHCDDPDPLTSNSGPRRRTCHRGTAAGLRRQPVVVAREETV